MDVGGKDVSQKLARDAWVNAGAPIVALVLVVAIGAFVALLSFADQQNRSFAEGSRRLVQNTLEGRARTQADIDLDFANWNDAYQAVSLRWNPAWVSANFYSNVTDALIVFNSGGAVRYAWVADNEHANTQILTAGVVRAAREDFDLGDLAHAPQVAGTVAHSLVRLNGRLAIVAIAAIAPEDDQERLSQFAHREVWYLGAVQVLDAAEVAAIGRSLDLASLTFSQTARPDGVNVVALPIATASGREIGALSWRDQRPGSRTFATQIVPVMLGLLLIGVLTIIVARRLVLRQVAVSARAESMAESNRLKSEFLATMSHELRTPLNAIIGYAELIQEEGQHLPAYEAVGDDADQIMRAARHLQELVTSILDQSRIEAGHMRLRPERVLVRELLSETEEMFAPLARARGNVLKIDSTEEGTAIFVDPQRARQCLLNLVGNAVKFTQDGEVSIRARKSVRAGIACITFDVTDTGVGIRREDADLIFEPFGQADDAARKHGGAGLGLSIARKLARAMGGDIVFASELGRGSCFSLTLPTGSQTGAALVRSASG